MKKILLCVAALATLVGCTVDDGTTPGGDSQPRVTIYQYAAPRPLDPDQSVKLRLANNGKVQELYYFAEPAADKEAFVKANGADAYMERVKEKGTRKSATAEDLEVSQEGLAGTYAITVVAVGGGRQTMAATVFNGIPWSDVTTGTYTFTVLADRATPISPKTQAATLQVNASDATQYRLKDLFGAGYSMKFNATTSKGTDVNGDFVYVRIPAQETPYTYTVSGARQVIGVRDVGYWQGNDAYATHASYGSKFYTSGATNSAIVRPQYYITAGNLGAAGVTTGYGSEMFIAD